MWDVVGPAVEYDLIELVRKVEPLFERRPVVGVRDASTVAVGAFPVLGYLVVAEPRVDLG
jgi:hypothetical protein